MELRRLDRKKCATRNARVPPPPPPPPPTLIQSSSTHCRNRSRFHFVVKISSCQIIERVCAKRLEVTTSVQWWWLPVPIFLWQTWKRRWWLFQSFILWQQWMTSLWCHFCCPSFIIGCLSKEKHCQMHNRPRHLVLEIINKLWGNQNISQSQHNLPRYIN